MAWHEAGAAFRCPAHLALTHPSRRRLPGHSGVSGHDLARGRGRLPGPGGVSGHGLARGRGRLPGPGGVSGHDL